jgi:hypothetical protein
MRTLIQTQRAFNATPDDHPAEKAAFDQSAQLLADITADPQRAQFALSGLTMLVVALPDEETDLYLSRFKTDLPDEEE